LSLGLFISTKEMNGMTTVNEELDSIKKEVAKTSFQA
jgi:hypothetical protein